MSQIQWLGRVDAPLLSESVPHSESLFPRKRLEKAFTGQPLFMP